MGKTVLAYFISIAVGYLFGSVDFAIVVTKIVAKKDIRTMGSGNAGMTNVLRTQGKGAAAATFAGDFLKGFGSVWLARLFFRLLAGGAAPVGALWLAGMAALLGHSFPVYFHFKGGKGIAVSCGFLCAIDFWLMAMVLSLFLILTFTTKIVSLGSVAAAAALPFAAAITERLHGRPFLPAVLYAVLVSAFVLYRHRGNIKRLATGTEYKFGATPPTAATKKPADAGTDDPAETEGPADKNPGEPAGEGKSVEA